jgi:hypothetical protein
MDKKRIFNSIETTYSTLSAFSTFSYQALFVVYPILNTFVTQIRYLWPDLPE